MTIYGFAPLLAIIVLILVALIASIIAQDIVQGALIGAIAFIITFMIEFTCLPRLTLKYGETYKTEYKAEDVALCDTGTEGVKYIASWDEGDGTALTQKANRTYFCERESYVVKIDYKWGFLTDTEYELYVQR